MTLQPVQGRFIGREDELERLRALFDRASSTESLFAVVAGAAGVGKSSLLTKFTEHVEARVLIGSCLPLGEHGVPFAPLVEMFRPLESDPEFGHLIPAGLVTATSVASVPALEPISQTHLFQALLELISRLAENAPTVIVIEDLHWADRSTRDLVSFLVPNLRTDRLLLVLSYRTEDVHRDHPLRPVLAELARNPRVDHIDVAPFSDSLVAELIEALTGTAPTKRTLDAVVKRTQGNPYFVEQLVAANGLDGRSLPDSLRDLLLVRADVVSPAVRRTLRILSVAEDQVDDVSLAAIAESSVNEIRDHVHEALDKRLLITGPTGTQFAHALLREALQADLLAGERAQFNAAFAQVIAAKLERQTGNRTALLAQLAHHREAAGEIGGAIEAWSGAATAAEALFAFAEAHHHLSRIITNWNRTASPAEHAGAELADLLVRAAEDAFLGGDPEDASRLARQAISLVDAVAEPRVVGVLHERLARYVRDTGEHDQALELVERALELVPEDPPSADRSRVLAGVAGQLMTHGRYIEARSFASRAVDEARATGSTLAEADALNTLGVLATVIDDVELGLATIQQALAQAERCGDTHQQMRSYWNTMACLSDAGEWDRCLDAFGDAIVQLPRLGQGHLLPELYANAADIFMKLGRWDEAQATIDEANQRYSTGGDDTVLTEIVAERGDFETARRLIESKTARNVFTDQEQQGWPLVNLATLDTWEGRHPDARRAVDAALAVTADLDGPIASAYALAVGCRCEADAADIARRIGSTDDVDHAAIRCRSFVEQIDDLLGRPGPDNGWKREVGALAMQCKAELGRAAGVPDPKLWAAATSAWDRMRMPYHAAYSRFRNAEALVLAADDRSGVSLLLDEAHSVVASLGARPLQALIEAFARRARVDIGLPAGAAARHGLTAREHEVLATLSSGATNRQIASTLFISEKTASVHVSNIMRKLGVSNRGEAAAFAHREGIGT